MTRAMMLGLLLAVAGCSTAPDPAPAPPNASAPPTAAAPPPASPEPKPVVQACNAAQYQHLVGRPRSEIPVPVKPELQRVACTACPVTMDFNPNRLNFFFDAETGLIKEVRCG
jgi:hypothetical protein